MQYQVSFPGGTVQYLLQSSFNSFAKLVDADNCIFISDSNIAGLYPHFFAGRKVIIMPAGEEHKNLQTAGWIIEELLRLEAHRSSSILAVGGGVVTDMAGFVASVYMRGVPFGFIPTSLLGMVDAAIGGKNGVDIGLYKNAAGNFKQPQFILYDAAFLNTLPAQEWSNGFAEIIKYACLFDKVMFDELSVHNIAYYKNSEAALMSLISRCIDWKNKIVLADETESGQRKLLNFGHTLGHAIETIYSLPHGYAVAIGMVAACRISEKECGLSHTVTNQLIALLAEYNLPAQHPMELNKVMEVLVRDKKRAGENIDYIVLEDTGKPGIRSLSFEQIKQALAEL